MSKEVNAFEKYHDDRREFLNYLLCWFELHRTDMLEDESNLVGDYIVLYPWNTDNDKKKVNRVINKVEKRS